MHEQIRDHHGDDDRPLRAHQRERDHERAEHIGHHIVALGLGQAADHHVALVRLRDLEPPRHFRVGVRGLFRQRVTQPVSENAAAKPDQQEGQGSQDSLRVGQGLDQGDARGDQRKPQQAEADIFCLFHLLSSS